MVAEDLSKKHAQYFENNMQVVNKLQVSCEVSQDFCILS